MGIESNLGRYSPLPKEIEEIRKQAMEAGHDPDAAEAAFREKMSMANARITEEEREKMLNSLSKDLSKKLAS